MKDVFAGARALPADARPGYLVEACAGDEALRHEVESLLASDAGAKSFLEVPAVLFDDTIVAKDLEGQRIGPYRIASRIGVGGMGEVYRARDTKLNRQVAIKVLLPAVADDPDRLARFSREAQVLASLNHPHIAQIHGLEDADGVRALVMELVEGPTLADRIVQGAIPVDEALSIARQIAEALEAAHEMGIIHRDLKPANIKVREDGTVKVLDFGLAKAIEPPHADVDVLKSPTMSGHATDASVLLGTAAYMSPEQARGKAADRRADIWAFGCVLYEMLARRQVFAGDNVTDVMAAIVKNEPDWTMLPADTPALIRRLIRRCLEKDRTRRLDSATAARLEIEEALTASPAEAPAGAAASRRVALVALAALASGALVAALITWAMTRSEPPASAQPSHFAIVPTAAQPLNSSGGDRDIAVSPDGRHLVYLAGGGLGVAVPLMVRATNQLEARQLPVAGIGVFPSPDSRWIGFFTNTEIKKVSITGGAAVSLCRFTGRPLGASWGDDNTIVFATDDPTTGLWRVSADGGEATVLTTPGATQQQSDHVFPSVLPSGRGVLFTISAGGQAKDGDVAVLDSRTGQHKTLVRGGSQAEYVDPLASTGQAGYLIYAAAGALRAVKFDLARLEVLSEPATVVERVMTKTTGAANYAVSRQGTLFYVPGGMDARLTPKSLVWVDRTGHEEPINLPPRVYGPPRISPDGTRLALEILDQGGADIWIWDLGRETMKRLTLAPGIDGSPQWTTRAGSSSGRIARACTTSTARNPTAQVPSHG